MNPSSVQKAMSAVFALTVTMFTTQWHDHAVAMLARRPAPMLDNSFACGLVPQELP
jgi:hypothetical protein